MTEKAAPTEFEAAANTLAETFVPNENITFMLDIFKATCVICDQLEASRVNVSTDNLKLSISVDTMGYIENTTGYKTSKSVVPNPFIKEVVSKVVTMIPEDVVEYKKLKAGISAYTNTTPPV
jgi:hypothetical protein